MFTFNRERATALEGNDDAIGAEAVAIYQNILEVVIESFEAINLAGADPAVAQKVTEISQQCADASVRLVRYLYGNC